MFRRVLALSLAVILNACSFVDSGGLDDLAAEETQKSAPLPPVNISGTVLAESGSSQAEKARAHAAPQNLSPLVGAQVRLEKCFPDQTCAEVASAISDESGQFGFTQVPAAQAGSGRSTDFYYRLNVLKGEIHMRYAFAPERDVVLNVTSDTTVAATILSDVVRLASFTDVAIPPARVFDDYNKLVSSGMLASRTDPGLPAIATSNMTRVAEFADALVASSTNAEYGYELYRFNAEWTSITKRAGVSGDARAGYFRRMAKYSCGQMGEYQPLPFGFAEVLGRAAAAGKRFTPAQIVTAYNDNNENLLDVDLTAVVTGYADQVLAPIEVTLDADKVSNSFSRLQHLALYSKRDLEAAEFDENTLLDTDQALAFLYYIDANDSEIQLCLTSVKVLGTTLAALTGDDALQKPMVADVQIYHDDHGVCRAQGKARFRAEVSAYSPFEKNEVTDMRVHSVRVLSSDQEALGLDHWVPDNQSGALLKKHQDLDKYFEDNDAYCVSFDNPVTYTVIALLFDLSEYKFTYTTTHPKLTTPAVHLTTISKQLVAEEENPLRSRKGELVVDPVVGQAVDLAEFGDDARLIYQYQFSHFDTVSKLPVGDCPASTRLNLYDNARFLFADACDVNNCAALSGIRSYRISCKVDVTAVVVDSSNRVHARSRDLELLFCNDGNKDNRCN